LNTSDKCAFYCSQCGQSLIVEVPVFSRIFSLPPCPLISFLAPIHLLAHTHSKIKKTIELILWSTDTFAAIFFNTSFLSLQ
jgi:hypothetical protein